MTHDYLTWTRRVAEELRAAREEFEAELDRLDARDLARIIPANELPEASGHREES